MIRSFHRIPFTASLSLLLGALCLAEWSICHWHVQYESHSTRPKRWDDRIESLSLLSAELPGYTGWSRPEHTLAPYYDIIYMNSTAEVDMDWVVTVQCIQKSCSDGGAHFYVRIYGPAIISGQVQDHRNGTYSIHAVPLDPGEYTVEVVLTFSRAPRWSEFPLSRNVTEPLYEGYLLPGFPMQLVVQASPTPVMDSTAPCSLDVLTEQTRTSAIVKVRWVVVDKINSRHHLEGTDSNRVSLRRYQNAQNALGVFMDYVPRTCSFIRNATAAAANCLHSNTEPLHIIFVGDSVMRLQKAVFDEFIGTDYVQTTLVSTSGGIVQMFPNITTDLMSIWQANPNQRRFVLFNTGLHDIAQLCSRKWRATRRQHFGMSDARLSCTEIYQHSLQKLVDFMVHYPADLRVFQSTTAGWPKYGNFGFAWPPSEGQPFPLSPNFVAHFNDIALDVVTAAKVIPIMDGFWITLPRPDNREVNVHNAIGKHLVHPGAEVLNAMMRIWLMIVLRHVSTTCLDTAIQQDK